LEAMTRMHEISSFFVRGGELRALLQKVLDAALLFTKADMGNIQLMDPESGKLIIQVQHGFKKDWLDYWQGVDESRGSCGASLKKGGRVIVEDVTKSPIFSGSALDMQVKQGVRAVQSTPMMNGDGNFLGVISTHFKTPHQPDENTLGFLDLLARQTA